MSKSKIKKQKYLFCFLSHADSISLLEVSSVIYHMVPTFMISQKYVFGVIKRRLLLQHHLMLFYIVCQLLLQEFCHVGAVH